MSEQEQTNDQQRAESPIAEGLSAVVNAAFGVGAAIAKTLAEATASGKTVAQPDSGQGPLGEMVHYGVTTVSNVIGLVVSVMGDAKSQDEESSPSRATPETGRAAAASTKSIPTVHQGRSLRMPLSMENPGDQPMENLLFVCQKMEARELGDGQPLLVDALRFQPEHMDIAPKDFEKLTLLIDTDSETAPGRYVALIGVAEGGLELKVEFEVALDEDTA
jgi:hypothetical protein